jgi:hypothetical protein
LILTPGPKGIVTHRQNTERKKEDDAGRKEVLLVACLPQKRSRLGISANASELPRRPKIVSSLGIHVEAEMQKCRRNEIWNLSRVTMSGVEFVSRFKMAGKLPQGPCNGWKISGTPSVTVNNINKVS